MSLGRRFFLFLALLLFSLGGAAQTPPVRASDLDIPYCKSRLDNGLTVIVHEDHALPLVAVRVWYKVGSMDEHPGKTGFAHLFEHLMFQGSEHWPDDYFRPLEKAGAKLVNGATSNDYTFYLEDVPKNALDVALFLEADRMGHLLIDQKALDEQRLVVKNEKRQGENAPYGRVEEVIAAHAYPAGHPYSWTVIGKMEDLDAAAVQDAQGWYQGHYDPGHAVLVFAGDLSCKEGETLAKLYFDALSKGQEVARPSPDPAPMETSQHLVMEDRVPQTRIWRVWNVPPEGSGDALRLDLATTVLGGTKTSRLYLRLVEKEQLATDVSSYIYPRFLGSQVMVEAGVRDGVDPARVEAVVEEEISRFLKEGPSEDELFRAKTLALSQTAKRLDAVGGFSGRAQTLAQSEVLFGDPLAWKRQLEAMEQSRPDAVRVSLNQWLAKGSFTVVVVPEAPKKEALGASSGSPPQRLQNLAFARPPGAAFVHDTLPAASSLPPVGPAPAIDFPRLQHARLDNGMKVILAPRPGSFVVATRLLLDAGQILEKENEKGLSDLLLSMLEEGTKDKSGQEIALELERLGASFEAEGGWDRAQASLLAPKGALAPGLLLVSEMVRSPSFPEEQLLVKKNQMKAAIAQEKNDPLGAAKRALFPRLYPHHPYGYVADEKDVDARSREDLVDFHGRAFSPQGATLVVAGDVEMREVLAAAEAAFGDWRGDVAESAPALAPAAPKSQIYLLDKPLDQSTILVATLVPPTGFGEEVPLSALNAVLGGLFTSRLNMNLREVHGWTYGARSSISGARQKRPWVLSTQVERSATAPAAQEIIKEIQGMAAHPPEPEELTSAKESLALSLLGRMDTTAKLADSVAFLATYGLPDAYFERFSRQVRGLNAREVARAARYLDPGAMTWVVAGDLAAIEKGLGGLGMQVEVLEP